MILTCFIFFLTALFGLAVSQRPSIPHPIFSRLLPFRAGNPWILMSIYAVFVITAIGLHLSPTLAHFGTALALVLSLLFAGLCVGDAFSPLATPQPDPISPTTPVSSPDLSPDPALRERIATLEEQVKQLATTNFTVVTERDAARTELAGLRTTIDQLKQDLSHAEAVANRVLAQSGTSSVALSKLAPEELHALRQKVADQLRQIDRVLQQQQTEALRNPVHSSGPALFSNSDSQRP